MATAGKTHDCTLEDASAGTPKVGLMLVRKNGQRSYKLADFQTIAPRTLTTEELDSAQLPPQVALTWFQDDWSAGLGGINARTAPKRYASGIKAAAMLPSQMQLTTGFNATVVDVNPTAFKPSGFATVGTEEWSFQERDVYSWNYTDGDWDKGTAPQAVAVVYRNGVEFGANTFVPAWLASDDSASTYIYKADADANWTLSTLATKTFKFFARARTAAGAEILVGGNAGGANTHKIYSSSDPTNAGSWALLATIGNADSAITGLITDGRTVLVLKTNGVWAYYSDGSIENLTPEFESMADPKNFLGSFNWNGHLLLPLGSGGMRELRDGVLHDVSMKTRYAPDQTNLHGRVVAITGEPSRLFVLILDSTNLKYNLITATWDTFEGVSDYHWHHVGSIAYTTSTVAEHSALFAAGVPSGSTIHHRIYAGVESGGSNLLPYLHGLDNPRDANFVFNPDSDAELVTTAWDANFVDQNKLYRSITCTTSGLGSGANDHYAYVQYRVDGGSWTYVTGTQSTSKLTTSPQTLTFAAEVSGKTLELKFLLVRGTTTTTTPIIKNFTVTAALRLSAIKSIPMQCYIADNVTLLNGARGGTGKSDLSQLVSWNAGAPEVVLKEPDGTSRNCVFMPGTFRQEEVAVVKGRRSEYVVSFLLGVV